MPLETKVTTDTEFRNILPCNVCGNAFWERETGRVFCDCTNKVAIPDFKKPESYKVEQFPGGGRGNGNYIRGLHLLSQIALRRWAEGMEVGRQHHGAYNWLNGIPAESIWNHMMTHFALFLQGDDSEDHLGHALCRLAMLIHFSETRPELFDAMPPGCKEGMLLFLQRTNTIASESEAQVPPMGGEGTPGRSDAVPYSPTGLFRNVGRAGGTPQWQKVADLDGTVTVDYLKAGEVLYVNRDDTRKVKSDRFAAMGEQIATYPSSSREEYPICPEPVREADGMVFTFLEKAFVIGSCTARNECPGTPEGCYHRNHNVPNRPDYCVVRKTLLNQKDKPESAKATTDDSPLQQQIQRLSSALPEANRWREVLKRERDNYTASYRHLAKDLTDSTEVRRQHVKTIHQLRDTISRLGRDLTLSTDSNSAMTRTIHALQADLKLARDAIGRLREVIDWSASVPFAPGPHLAGWLEDRQRNCHVPDENGATDYYTAVRYSKEHCPTGSTLFRQGWDAAFNHLINLCRLNEIHSSTEKKSDIVIVDDPQHERNEIEKIRKALDEIEKSRNPS